MQSSNLQVFRGYHHQRQDHEKNKLGQTSNGKFDINNKRFESADQHNS